MRYGPIPEYAVDIDGDKAGIEMIRVKTAGGRVIWTNFQDPILDGKTITRDDFGSLAAN